MRDLVKIIDEILVAAPDLAEHLEPIKRSTLYSAPEMMKTRWQQVSAILNEHAGYHPKGAEIQKIFNDI